MTIDCDDTWKSRSILVLLRFGRFDQAWLLAFSGEVGA